MISYKTLFHFIRESWHYLLSPSSHSSSSLCSQRSPNSYALNSRKNLSWRQVRAASSRSPSLLRSSSNKNSTSTRNPQSPTPSNSLISPSILQDSTRRTATMPIRHLLATARSRRRSSNPGESFISNLPALLIVG